VGNNTSPCIEWQIRAVATTLDPYHCKPKQHAVSWVFYIPDGVNVEKEEQQVQSEWQ
jgi:hypothetical protein